MATTTEDAARRVLAWHLDPVTFAIDCGLPTPLDPYQEAVLRDPSAQLSIVASRQSGKSTTVAALALYTAVTHREALVLIGATGERAAGELLRKCRRALSHLATQGLAPATTAESVLKLELSNGSRLVAIPAVEATIRGYSAPALIVVDEVAKVPDSFIAALRPMLAAGRGRWIQLTSAGHESGFAWRIATAAEAPGWSRYTVPASAIARFDPAWLQGERLNWGTSRYAREYECAWGAGSSQLFTQAVLAKARRPAPALEVAA